MKRRDIIYTCLTIITVIFLLASIFMLSGHKKNNEKPEKSVKISYWNYEGSMNFTPETVYSNLNIADTIATRSDFGCFVEFIDYTDLRNILEKKGPFTVFAPVDGAFERYLNYGVKIISLFNKDNNVRYIMKNHIVSGLILADNLVNMDNINTIAGRKLRVRNQKGMLYIENSVILKSYRCENGMIHAVDTLLISEEEYRCVLTAF
jgi:uncharacterized surface protein with fasciclin (FAS1) repeats